METQQQQLTLSFVPDGPTYGQFVQSKRTKTHKYNTSERAGFVLQAIGLDAVKAICMEAKAKYEANVKAKRSNASSLFYINK